MTLDGQQQYAHAEGEAFDLSMQFFASCPPGVADLTAAELRGCGATQTREFKLGVHVRRHAGSGLSRVPVVAHRESHSDAARERFQRPRPKRCTKASSSIDWTQHLAAERHARDRLRRLVEPASTHTHFGALKTKDAIVDQFRERTGERPSVAARAARRAHRCAPGSRSRDAQPRSFRRQSASSRLSRARRRCAAEGKPRGRGAACAAAGRRSPRGRRVRRSDVRLGHAA